jgi:hypothetical protein
LTGFIRRDNVSLLWQISLSRWRKLAALFVGTGERQAARWSLA